MSLIARRFPLVASNIRNFEPRGPLDAIIIQFALMATVVSDLGGVRVVVHIGEYGGGPVSH